MAATTESSSLLIAPQWIGDAVMTEPLVRRLAARGERITVAALPWVSPVYRVMPGVADVIDLPFRHGGLQLQGRWALARALRGRFGTAYVCPNSLKSALLPWLAGIPVRRGYTGEMRYGLLTERLANPSSEGTRPPMVEFYAALSLLGQAAHLTQLQGDLRPVLQVRSSLLDTALERVGQMPSVPTPARRSFVVFAPGAEYGPAKRWPVRHFAALAERIDRTVFLLGSAKERELCAEIAAAANVKQRGHVINLAGQTGLLEAFALIANAYRVVSNDSGLMHVAAAFGVPQVAVFGSSSPDHTPPLSDNARVVWLRLDPNYNPPLACAPCYERSCPLGHTRCLEDVGPERVAALL